MLLLYQQALKKLYKEYKELAISFNIRNAIASFIDTQIIQPYLLIVKNSTFSNKSKRWYLFETKCYAIFWRHDISELL